MDQSTLVPFQESTDLKPGALYLDVPEGVYRAAHGLSQSDLKLVARSYAHYQEAEAQRQRRRDGAPLPDDPGPSATLEYGRALHTAILEPRELEARVCVRPDGMRRGTRQWNAWVEEHAGDRQILTEREYASLEGIREAVARHPTANALLNGNGLAEVSAWWDREIYGVEGAPNGWAAIRMKGRADRYLPRLRLLVDPKTTDDASPEKFTRSIHTYGYHIQAAAYLRGFATAVPVDQIVFVAIEKSRPYGIRCYRITDTALERADDWIDATLKKFYADTRHSHPEYPDGISSIDLPKWGYWSDLPRPTVMDET